MKKIPPAVVPDVPFRFFYQFWTFCLFFLLSVTFVFAHPITGVWRGQVQCGKGAKKITSTIEVKLVDVGSTIVGTVYYLGAGKNYIRYSLKGSFWGNENSIYWQDYSIINMNVKKTKDVHVFNETMKYFANYKSLDENNGKLLGYCMLDKMPRMTFELEKVKQTLFPDEWDAVITGHYAGNDNKEVMDSIWAIASEPAVSGESGNTFNPAGVIKEPGLNELNSDLPGFGDWDLIVPDAMGKQGSIHISNETCPRQFQNSESVFFLPFQSVLTALKLADSFAFS